MVTIQYEVTIARRGQLTTTVKERSFKTEDVMTKWLDRPENQGNVTVLRSAYECDVCRRPAQYYVGKAMVCEMDVRSVPDRYGAGAVPIAK